MWIYKSGLSPQTFISSESEYNKKYLAELDSEYNGLKDSDIPVLSLSLFKEYEKSGNRLDYERLYFRRRTMLRDFALKVWLGDESAIKHLEKIIREICAEDKWCLPAHDYTDDFRPVLDLFAAETAQALTEIVSLLYDRLPADISYLAVETARERVLKPFTEIQIPYNWENMKSNWCAVCGGSVGMTAIYLTEDITELENIRDRLVPVFANYMESFANDGACLEGLYYWNYGMMYLTAFLELYKERTGDDFPVNTEKLIKMADFAHKCCISDGITVSFSDASENDRIYTGLSSKLTELYGAMPIADEYKAFFLGDECGRWCKAARDIAWTREQPYTEKEMSSVLHKANWAVARGGNLSFAFKGGNNGEPHNHLDVGSFMAVKNGKVILCDLGAGEYTRDYFSVNRYHILCNSSKGHSVPIIDGHGQRLGADCCTFDFIAGGASARADICGAYRLESLRNLERKIALKEDKLVITDTYITKEPLKITERFVTRHKAEITEDGAYITADGECIAKLSADTGCVVSISERKHYEHDGTVSEITVIDFSFTAYKKTVFKAKLQ